MLKKGASRKGMRRRQAVAASTKHDDGEMELLRASKTPVIKLDPSNVLESKPIARIEPNPSTVVMEEQSSPKRDEHTWGKKSTTRDHRWIWSFSALAIILMFAGIAFVVRKKESPHLTAAQANGGFEVLSEDAPIRLPMPIYQQKPYQTQVRCTEIFQQVVSATDATTIIPLARPTPTLEASLRRHWQPWQSMPKMEQNDQVLFDTAEVQGQDFLTMSGLCEDGSPFLAFFVEQNGKIQIDWEATIAAGEAKIDTLVANPTEHPIAMRAVITPSPYYLPTLPESDYESYQLSFPGNETIVWAYAPRDSMAHQKINEILLQHNELLDVVLEARITLKIRKTKGPSSQHRFFITEVLHKDWVMP